MRMHMKFLLCILEVEILILRWKRLRAAWSVIGDQRRYHRQLVRLANCDPSYIWIFVFLSSVDSCWASIFVFVASFSVASQECFELCTGQQWTWAGDNKDNTSPYWPGWDSGGGESCSTRGRHTLTRCLTMDQNTNMVPDDSFISLESENPAGSYCGQTDRCNIV